MCDLKRRPGLWPLAFAITLAAGCGKKQDGAPGMGGGFQAPPTPVETAEVVQKGVADRFEAVGTIEAAEMVTIVSEIPGIVVKLPFNEGERVAAGALLAQLDDAELAASLTRAEAILAQKRASYERVKLVVAQRAGAPQDLDDAEAELKIAEADVDLARVRLAKARIAAPFAGRVGARQVSPGAFIQPGTPITVLSSIEQIKVTFSAPERYVPELKRGAAVTITTPAYAGDSLSGVIDMIEPVLDAETRSAAVIARAANPGERFKPGMSANVSALLSERAEAVTIPSEAVFAEGTETLVYVVKPDSTVSRTPIALGTRLAGSVEVVSGLAPGQRVVRSGHQKLYEGARIFPVSSQAMGGPGAPAETGGSPGPGSSPAAATEESEG